MTNKEKAKEIALQLFDDGHFCHNGISRKEIEKAVMTMAQWKDAILEEKMAELKKNIITARDDKEYYKPKVDVALDWVVRLIDEIFKNK